MKNRFLKPIRAWMTTHDSIGNQIGPCVSPPTVMHDGYCSTFWAVDFVTRLRLLFGMPLQITFVNGAPYLAVKAQTIPREPPSFPPVPTVETAPPPLPKGEPIEHIEPIDGSCHCEHCEKLRAQV